MQPRTTSIVIRALNEAEHLPVLLESIANQTDSDFTRERLLGLKFGNPTIEMLDGRKLSYDKEFKGKKVLLLDFWAPPWLGRPLELDGCLPAL